MDLKRLETLGLIEKIGPNQKLVLSQLERARRDLLTSAANLPIDDEWAYTIAYHAMLRAGRALLSSFLASAAASEARAGE